MRNLTSLVTLALSFNPNSDENLKFSEVMVEMLGPREWSEKFFNVVGVSVMQ